MDQLSAAIYGLEGLALSESECDFFTDSNPLGFILFTRNCESPAQVRALTDSLRELTGRNCPVLIDNEGGRVQRFKPPQWREFPPALRFGEQATPDQATPDQAAPDMDAALEALRFNTLQMAEELQEAGVNVNCAPVLDILFNDAHDIIGDRAFGSDPDLIARLGLSVCRHYLAAGITPIIKHIPGHGRAKADSHKDLPVVDTPHAELSATDFAPFKSLAASDIGKQIWAMSAHVVYSDIDPQHPASASPTVINDVIRSEIGFDGILVSDDLDMEALEAYGDVGGRTRTVMEAGCDIALHCSGNLENMKKVAENCPKLSEKAQKRLQSAAHAPNMAV